LGLPDIATFDISGFEHTGLTYETETGLLSGIPTEKGEHPVLFLFKLKTSAEDSAFHEKKLLLIVNPNPKSLWQDLPSDQTDPYWKPDAATAAFDIGDRKLVIASKRGRSHAHEGKFRDDDFDFAFFEESGWGILAVADGAGSAKYARQGSKIACEAIIEFFREKLTPEQNQEFEAIIQSFNQDRNEENQKKLSRIVIDHLGKAAHFAHLQINEEALRNSAVIKDYSTTLEFCLLKKYDFGYFVTSFWVGDGGIGIYNREKLEVIALGVPDGGEYAGQTRFLTMPDIFANESFYRRFSIKIVEAFTAVILMTDGITDPKFQTDANLLKVEKWNELWDDLGGNNADNVKVSFDKTNTEIENELLTWLDFWSAGNHDDRTIAIIY
ncbi:MAG: PP2C family serine/threonine-protein phosphatase, partial [Bacteroidota bacterium]